MILIGENIHVISKSVQNALIERNEEYISDLVSIQGNMDFVDLNVGPAKKGMDGILPWLVEIVSKNCDLGISFDTTNISEMALGLRSFSGKNFINSVSLDYDRINPLCDLAVEHSSNLIALTLSKENGIPKTSDGRLEIAFEIYEKCLENGVKSDNLFFDPLILPICIDQSQATEALNTIKMIKESFDPPVKTLVGLSNISNGSPLEVRPLLNRVFAVLAYGAGLDSAIVDAKDSELVRIMRMFDKSSLDSDVDRLYFDLAGMVRDFGEIEDISYDENDIEQVKIIKAAKVLLNKEVYSHSFTQI